MQRRTAMLVSAAAAAFLLTSCAPQGQYYWGTYSESLYSYYRDPSNLDDYRHALAVIIADTPPRQRVPPGIFAEMGYLEMQDGNYGLARRYFDREKQEWPEAGVFMDRMIDAIDNNREYPLAPQDPQGDVFSGGTPPGASPPDAPQPLPEG